MRLAVAVAVPLLAATGVAATAAATGCSALNASSLSAEIFFPTSDVYRYEAQEFWSNTEIMAPGCVFRPQSSEQLASGVEALVKAEAEFAVRGGGHMGIRGSNNIDDGVLVVMSNLTTLELSDDRSVVSIGPGYRWSDVYAYLSPYGLAAAGGRLGPVGVPGLLLAGGINYYGNQVGFGCDTVINYEVVLANGSIVNANRSSHADLFWALKGGSSNFGIVTRFDMETIDSPLVWAGIYTVAEEYVGRFLEATATYAANISNPKTHIVPALVPEDGATLGSVILFYDSANESYPDIFKPFTDIPAVSSTLGFKTLYEFAEETGEVVTPHINDIFVAGTIKAPNYSTLLSAISLINTTFFAQLPKLTAQIPSSNISIIELDFQPIGSAWLSASASRGGNALGLNASEIYICYAEVVEWIGEAYDDIVNQWVEETTYLINNKTLEAGFYDPFNYMGDAAGFQDIFGGYGAGGLERLRTVAMRYDPDGVWQRFMPGGFKVF
ncbi:FAD-binding domain-containing protein [Aspergillus heteromorphus CBS 117.55]|uniref:FAD-binding domain-containing protein n=1 Tax=Aspergillus heteromorphus CBS 117.55 TaxID=1448321 RepID=A0A317VM66_9EURO|nr:FAD-binding domain-containing protein [Aspergillus heteromorphus CBS 117.55]PWY74321.1 FAD-binding domain-containing protein [Aspergillus heteromorphus CBS 117.55]